MHPALEHSAAVATVLAFLIAVPTLYIVKDQFYDDLDKSKIENTLAYVTRYRTDPMDHDRMIIDAKLLTADAKSIYGGDHKEYKSRVHDFDTKNDLDGPFIKMIGFYDEMYVCIQRDVCDLNTALVLIGRNIRSDFAWVGAEIDGLREESVSSPGFGCGFVALAKESIFYLNRSAQGKHVVLPPLVKCQSLDIE